MALLISPRQGESLRQLVNRAGAMAIQYANDIEFVWGTKKTTIVPHVDLDWVYRNMLKDGAGDISPGSPAVEFTINPTYHPRVVCELACYRSTRDHRRVLMTHRGVTIEVFPEEDDEAVYRRYCEAQGKQPVAQSAPQPRITPEAIQEGESVLHELERYMRGEIEATALRADLGPAGVALAMLFKKEVVRLDSGPKELPSEKGLSDHFMIAKLLDLLAVDDYDTQVLITKEKGRRSYFIQGFNVANSWPGGSTLVFFSTLHSELKAAFDEILRNYGGSNGPQA